MITADPSCLIHRWRGSSRRSSHVNMTWRLRPGVSMTSLLVVVDCDGGTVLLDAEITFRSHADLNTLSRKLAKDVETYAGRTVCFGYSYARGASYSASIERAHSNGAVHVSKLAEFVVRNVY